MAEFKENITTSPDLVQLVTQEDHLTMAERIKPHVPHCITMYNSLRQQGGGHTSHDNFFAAHGSSSCIVLCKKLSLTNDDWAVFCLEEEVAQLIHIVGSTRIIRWQDANTLIRHAPPYLLEPLQLLAKEKKANIRHVSTVVFTYYPDRDSDKLKVGPGFRVCRLGRAGIQHLVKRAKYESEIPLKLLYSVAQRIPYVGVYRDAAMIQESTVDVNNLPLAGDEEVPVAWACSSTSGCAGQLRTEDDFRRRGLGSIICTTVARQQATLLGFIPHAFIEDDNVASIAMFNKKAGWHLTHDAIWIIITQQKEK